MQQHDKRILNRIKKVKNGKLKNPVRAIREHCLECSGWSSAMVTDCPSSECSLYPFRIGKNPYRRRINREINPETILKMRAARESARKE